VNRAKTLLLTARIAFSIWGVKRAIDKQEKALRKERMLKKKLAEVSESDNHSADRD